MVRISCLVSSDTGPPPLLELLFLIRSRVSELISMSRDISSHSWSALLAPPPLESAMLGALQEQFLVPRSPSRTSIHLPEPDEVLRVRVFRLPAASASREQLSASPSVQPSCSAAAPPPVPPFDCGCWPSLHLVAFEGERCKGRLLPRSSPRHPFVAPLLLLSRSEGQGYKNDTTHFNLLKFFPFAINIQLRGTA